MGIADRRSHMGGPIPKFKEYHIWKALYCLSHEAPIGRKKLSALLDLGEGSTRTILALLQEGDAISVKKNGVTLTPEGKKLWAASAMNISPYYGDPITIGRYNCAVQVPRAEHQVKNGCEERDAAIKSGATGATTLVFSNGLLMYPGNEFPVSAKAERAIRNAFTLTNEDVIIIGTADTPGQAEEGAVTAGLALIGGLKMKQSGGEIISSMSNMNELVALAFMVHDLVGGLPVCAKSKGNLGIRIEEGKVLDNAYTGAILEEVLKVGTTVRRIATSGPYKGIRVIVAPMEMNNNIVAAIGVVDIRTMAGINNPIRMHENDEL